MAGRYKQPVRYGRGSADKSRVVGAHPSLGDYMFENQHINEEENMLISWTRKKSTEILPSLNSKEFFSGPPTFPAAPAFPWTLIFHQVQGFWWGKDFAIRLIFTGHKDFPIRLIFNGRKNFTIRLIFNGRKDFTIRLIFCESRHFCIYFQRLHFLIIFLSMRWLAQLFQAFRFKIVYCSNNYILYFMIIINIVWTL